MSGGDEELLPGDRAVLVCAQARVWFQLLGGGGGVGAGVGGRGGGGSGVGGGGGGSRRRRPVGARDQRSHSRTTSIGTDAGVEESDDARTAICSYSSPSERALILHRRFHRRNRGQFRLEPASLAAEAGAACRPPRRAPLHRRRPPPLGSPPREPP